MKQFKFMPLEEKIVLDAALVATLVSAPDSSADHTAEAQTSNDTHSSSSSASSDSPPTADAPSSPVQDTSQSTPLADHANPLKVLVVADNVKDSAGLAAAAKDNVVVVTYNHQTSTLQSILDQINEALQGQTADSIAFATSGQADSIAITASEWLTSDTVHSTNVQHFLESLSSYLNNNGRIDFLSCNLTQFSNTVAQTIDSMLDLSGKSIHVGASSDFTSNSSNWILEYGQVDAAAQYFDSQTLSAWDGHLATFTVTNTNDSGAGSLRQALADAKVAPGLDTINFNISGSGIHVIEILGSRLEVDRDTIIDATTQAGYNAATRIPVVNLVTNDAAIAEGLAIVTEADNVTIKGFGFNNFITGISAYAGTHDNITIQYNSFGLDGNSTLNRGIFIGDSATSTNWTIDSNAFISLTQYSITATVATAVFNNFTLSNNVFGTNWAQTINDPTFYNANYFRLNVSAINNSTFINNSFQGADSEPALQLGALNNSLVASNTFGILATASNFPLLIHGGVDSVISNNTIGALGTTNSNQYAINIDQTSSGFQILNNTILNPSSGGILVQEGSNSLIQGNHILNNTNTGIVILTGVDNVVSDNVIQTYTPPGMTITDAVATEGDNGTTTITFTVVLSTSAVIPIKVNYQTADNTALANSDYTARNGSLIFDVGQTSQTFTINIAGDMVYESNESFFVNLSSSINGTIVDGQAVGTIVDDETPPSITISGPNAQNEGNNGTTTAYTFTVSLSEASPIASSIDYTTVDGTALAGTDYVAKSGTLTFAAGETSKTITVLVNGDTVYEHNESFNLMLSNAQGVTIGTNAAAGTILNDDSLPAISISGPAAKNEGDSGITALNFTVNLSNASSSPISVDYSTADGSALAGSDYAAVAGTLNFAAGETSKTITVLFNGDTVYEPNESFGIYLLNASAGILVTSGFATASILNDDSANNVGKLWGVDQDDGQLFSISDPNDPLHTMTDYGKLMYRDANNQLQFINQKISSFAIDDTGIAYMTINQSLSQWGYNGSSGPLLAKIDLNAVQTGGGNVVTIVGAIGGKDVTGLTFDPLSGQLYGLQQTSGISTLITLNKATGAKTIIGVMSGIGEQVSFGSDLKFDAAGNLYAVDPSKDELYVINAANGRIIQVADDNLRSNLGLGRRADVRIEALAWDSTRNLFIGADDVHNIFGFFNTSPGNNVAIASTTSIGLTDIEGMDFIRATGHTQGLILDTPIASYAENGAAKFIVNQADIVANGNTFSNDAIAIGFAYGTGTLADQLNIEAKSGISLQGNAIYYNNVLMGTKSGGANGSNLILSLNDNANEQVVEKIIMALTFKNTSESPNTESRLLSIAVANTQGGLNNLAYKQVNVISVNDLAVIHDINNLTGVQRNVLTNIQDGSGNFLSVTDVDQNPNGIMAVELSVSYGSLYINLTKLGLTSYRQLETLFGIDFYKGDGQNDQKMSFYGTLSQANQVLAALQYITTVSKNDVLTVRVNDLQSSTSSSNRCDDEDYRGNWVTQTVNLAVLGAKNSYNC